MKWNNYWDQLILNGFIPLLALVCFNIRWDTQLQYSSISGGTHSSSMLQYQVGHIALYFNIRWDTQLYSSILGQSQSSSILKYQVGHIALTSLSGGTHSSILQYQVGHIALLYFNIRWDTQLYYTLISGGTHSSSILQYQV